MSVTYYSASRICNQLFNSTAISIPSSYYIALSTTTPDISGSNFTEPSGLNYSRVAVPSSSVYWTTATTNTLSNKLAITFPQSSGSWGTITYFGLYDASTSGNLFYYGILNPSVSVATSTTLNFDIGALVVTLSN